MSVRTRPALCPPASDDSFDRLVEDEAEIIDLFGNYDRLDDPRCGPAPADPLPDLAA